MLEVKPLSSSDHFVHPTKPVVGTAAIVPTHPVSSVVVTISPMAAAIIHGQRKEPTRTEAVTRRRSPLYPAYEEPEPEEDETQPISDEPTID